ncbi:MAG TPA: DUF4446 family protein [Candidatus Tumulicola sp.]|jgi:hypothetical protein
MPTAVILGSAGAIAVAIALSLVVYHFGWVRPALAKSRAVLAAHDGLLGGSGGGAADRLAALAGAQAAAAATQSELSQRVRSLESLAATDVSRIGFVRYNAHDDTGSELSYALAVLNREGDGVVVSSIYSRSDTRTYGKAVARFKPAVAASEEELQAIERAKAAPATNV